MKKFFKIMFSKNLHILLLDIGLIFLAYQLIMFYVENSPIKSQVLDNIKYTVICGIKSKTKKIYVQVTLKNVSKKTKLIILKKPFIKVVFAKNENKIFTTNFNIISKEQIKKIVLEKGKSKKFFKDFKSFHFQPGSYKLTCIILNDKRYQLITDFVYHKPF